MSARDASESTLRLFFAALPDPTVSTAMAATADALPLAAESRWVPRANYHLTVAFIGAVAASRLAEARRIGDGLREEAFSLRFDAYEYWPKPEVVVAAARTVPAPLQRLWHRLHEALAPSQWALEPKRLRPHVTLARKVSQAPVLQAMSSFDWCVREICLMRSETSTRGSAYTVVDTWPLLDKQKSI